MIMKQKLICISCLISFILFITGCVVTEEAPWNKTTVPVVFSVITPGQPVQVYLGKSYIETDAIKNQPYPEARVFVCGPDSNWMELNRLQNDSAMYMDADTLLRVEKGKTYSLRIDLADKTLHAKTTLPNESGTFTSVKCVVPDIHNHSASLYINDSLVDAYIGTLDVNYKLPENKEYGCYLVAFGNEVGYTAYLNGGIYMDNYFFFPKSLLSFPINIVTVDPYLKKFRITNSINYMSGASDISIILFSYGGVRPAFSNIQNGIGLFGSFITESKMLSPVFIDNSTQNP